MLTLQRMRDWQKYLLIPLFIGIALSFGMTATMTNFLSPGHDGVVGEIYKKEIMYSELARTQKELQLLKAFYQYYSYFPRPEVMDVEVARTVSMLNFNRNRSQYSNYMQNVIDVIIKPGPDETEAWAYLIYVKTGEKWGLNVGEQEVEDRVIGAFTEDGKAQLNYFHEFLKQLGTTESTFIEAMRRFMIVEKMAGMMCRASIGSKQAAYDNFKKREQERKFLYIKFDPEKYRDAVEATDANVFDYFTKNKRTKYRAPRKFRVRAAVLDNDAFLGDVAVSDNEVQAYYDRYKDYLYVSGTDADGANSYKPLSDVRADVEKNLKYEGLPEVVAARAGEMRQTLDQWMADKRTEVQRKEREERDRKKAEEENSETPEEDILPTEDDDDQPATPVDRDAIQYTDNKFLLDFSPLKTTYGDKVSFIDTDYFDPNDADLADFADLKDIFSAQLQREAKLLSRTKISEVVIGKGKAVVMQVIAESSPGITAFELIRDKVKEDYIKDQSVTLADEDCKRMFELIKDDYDIARLATDKNLKLVETEFVKNPQQYPDEAKVESVPEEDRELITNVFTQPLHAAQQLKAKTASYLYTVFEEKNPDIADLPEEKIAQDMASSQRGMLFNNTRRLHDMILSVANANYYRSPSVSSDKGQE